MNIWDQLVNDTEQADYQTSRLNNRISELEKMGAFGNSQPTRSVKQAPSAVKMPKAAAIEQTSVPSSVPPSRPADLPMPSEELTEPVDNSQEESAEGMTPAQKLMALAGTVLGGFYGLKMAGAAGRYIGGKIAPTVAGAAKVMPSPQQVAPAAQAAAPVANAATSVAKSFDSRNIARQQQQLNNRLFSALNSQGLTRKLSAQFTGPSNAKVVNIVDENGRVLTTVRNPDELASVLQNLSSLVPSQATKSANATKKSAPSAKPATTAANQAKKASTADNIASEAAKASKDSTKKPAKQVKKLSNDDLFDKKGNIKKGAKTASGKQVTVDDLMPVERKKK